MEHCQIISNPQSLVRTSSRSPNAIKVWLNQPSISTTPHFLVTRSTNKEDYSLDPEASPPILSYPTFPSFAHACALYIPNEQRIIFKSANEHTLRQWHFGETSVTTLPTNLMDPMTDRDYGACATSQQSGKMVMYSGHTSAYHQNAYIYQGGQSKLISVPHGRISACAALHPLDDNILYVFGGYAGTGRLNHAFKLFLNESNPTATDLKPMDDAKGHSSCLGYINREGLPAILIVGGVGDITLKSVFEYSITSNTYNEKASMPKAVEAPVLVIKDGFLYAFGGSPETSQVSRVDLSFTKPWEELEDLKSVSGRAYNMRVFPYN